MSETFKENKMSACCFCGQTKKMTGPLVQGNGLGDEHPVYICYSCIKKKEEMKQEEEDKKRIYLFVKYEDKDNAKSLGAKWDVENRRWYAPNNSFLSLLESYKTYPLKR